MLEEALKSYTLIDAYR